MMKSEHRQAIVAGVVCLAAGWWLASSPSSPIRPEPERPVLRLLAKLARMGLWVMWCADPPPPQVSELVYHARVDQNGQRVLDHGKGW